MITPLPFDSDLFGYPVGKCQVGEEWDEDCFVQEAGDYRLVYLFSEKPIQVAACGFSPVDVKLVFEKRLIAIPSEDPDITNYSGALTEGLLTLALEAGVFSRFHTDPGFVCDEYEKLYRHWITKVLEQRDLLLAADQAGFVGCPTSGKSATIELIAVAQSQRRKGWGRRLVAAAERLAFDRGARSISVATQAANTPAIALYQSLGYHLGERVSVNHWWSK